MVKPLSFKGDKKPKKRKRHDVSEASEAIAGEPVADHSENDSWTMPGDSAEVIGPTLIVLATNPPTCLAADPNGNVYACQLENMIEGDRRTAEPHNVQQVWVASRVAGMASNEVSFKGSHGGYLSCDQYGILAAKREARGREESFVIETVVDEDARSWFQLLTAATASKEPGDRRFISAVSEPVEKAERLAESGPKKVSITLRGDGEATSEDTRLILRMQTRFKPQTAEAKETARVKEKISRRELEAAAGRQLTDEEAKRLKRAKREGVLGEALLDVRAKGKHDKYA